MDLWLFLVGALEIIHDDADDDEPVILLFAVLMQSYVHSRMCYLQCPEKETKMFL